MATSEGIELAQGIRTKVEEVKKLCEGLDDNKASQAPPGRWSPKEILSHLLGPEGISNMTIFQAFLDQDIPKLDIEAENPFFSEKRAKMTLAEYLTQFESEYGQLADFVAGLSEEQLNRKAHIPLLKDTEIGEYPTLGMWANAIGEYHLGFHIDHLKEVLQAP